MLENVINNWREALDLLRRQIRHFCTAQLARNHTSMVSGTIPGGVADILKGIGRCDASERVCEQFRRAKCLSWAAEGGATRGIDSRFIQANSAGCNYTDTVAESRQLRSDCSGGC
jgi:hypothetical protein